MNQNFNFKGINLLIVISEIIEYIDTPRQHKKKFKILSTKTFFGILIQRITQNMFYLLMNLSGILIILKILTLQFQLLSSGKVH